MCHQVCITKINSRHGKEREIHSERTSWRDRPESRSGKDLNM